MGVNNCCVRSKQVEELHVKPSICTIKEPQLPMRSNPFNENNRSIDSEEEEWGVIREGDLRSVKSSKNMNLEVKKELIKKSLLKYPKGGFFINILIETLTITYKLCDDFGTIFKPRLDIKIDNYESQYYTNDEDKLNSSVNSDLNLSFNNIETTNNKNNEKRKSYDTVILPLEKYFNFNCEINQFLEELQIYSFIEIKLINDNNYPELNLSRIEMGEIKIPLNKIYLENNHNFDGYLSLKHKNIHEIGHIKIKIQISESSKKEYKISSFFQEDSTTELSFLEPKINSNNLENLILHYFHFDPITLDKYFFNENTRKISDAQKFFALEFINEKVFEVGKLHNYFKIAIQQENYILIYEIFNKLSFICEQNDIETIIKFYDNFHSETFQDFIKISEFTNYNPFITKHFLILIMFLFKKDNKIKITSKLNYQLLIQIIYSIFKKFSEIFKISSDYKFCIEIKDCIQLGINIFSEFITISSQNLDMKTYTEIYNNAFIINSYRIILFRLIEQFINESQIQSNLFRIFRKMIQIITNSDSKLIDHERIKGSPKEISKQFKILMIEKYESQFFSLINLVLKKYQHYPELHYNILLIIYHLINDLDTKYVDFAASKLGMKSFYENFQIYRGNLKAFSKLLNKLHLNILCLFSEIKIDPSSSSLNNLRDIFKNLKSFYTNNSWNKQNIMQFKQAKNYEVEIHQFITQIFANLSKTSEITDLFMLEEKIINDVLDYVSKISYFSDRNDGIEKKLQQNDKSESELNLVIKHLMLIAENTCHGLRNIFVNGMNSEFFDRFMNFLEEKYEKEENFLKILQTCEYNLVKRNYFSKKIESFIEEIKEKVHLFWKNQNKF